MRGAPAVAGAPAERLAVRPPSEGGQTGRWLAQATAGRRCQGLHSALGLPSKLDHPPL